MLHNPHRMDPALSTPWRFKKHLHALHFAAASNNLHALTQLISIWPSHVNCRYVIDWGGTLICELRVSRPEMAFISNLYYSVVLIPNPGLKGERLCSVTKTAVHECTQRKTL